MLGTADYARIVVGPVDCFVFTGGLLAHLDAVCCEERVLNGLFVDDGVGPYGDEGDVCICAVHFWEWSDEAADRIAVDV